MSMAKVANLVNLISHLKYLSKVGNRLLQLEPIEFGQHRLQKLDRCT